MNDAVAKKEKRGFKGLSKAKQALIIIACTVLFLFIVAIIGGLVALHMYCETKDYNIISLSDYTDEQVTLVAHRGFSAVAPENTTAAFEEAGIAGFDAVECDIYRTADGVWVVHHDTNTYRMMDESAFIEKITYEELLTYNYDNGSNIENYPNLKICTLDEYLAVCSEYSMTPVIELKGEDNTEHYDEVVASVENAGLADNVVYISFHIENLQKMRSLCNAALYYLVYTIDDEAIETALALGGECGIDFNGNKEDNTKEVIEKAQNAGLLLGAWTIDTADSALNLIDCGVTLITTNAITH
ncbi:MAG: hypothetical protein LUH82_02380 [Clostridiales bacterium]|nr:hypothetical protein [Clostridiales bacterium]